MSITPRVIQRTPDLGIKIKLQRLPVVPVQTDAPAPAPAGACNVFGAGWLVTLGLGDEGNWVFEGSDVSAHDYSADFRCTQIEIETIYRKEWPGHTFFAVMQGESMSDVRWEFEWDTPGDDPSVSAMGHAASSFGNVFQVKTQESYGEREARETLTVRAFCGDELVSTLTFIAVAIAE